ncbi:hypothetical protein [Bartonella sp. B1098]|uniref:DUF6990 domain-containing protein n=1 Tax=Bartonella sp. B1098 TaxID=2911421 RepID=UPI0020C358BD|nr:hypothetical protein [Bartonella sp. B1098]
MEIYEEKVTASRLKKELDKILAWIMENDCLHEMLRSQYCIPPWEKDSLVWSTGEAEFVPYALLHLAALALLGDVETLASYDESFTLGEMLGFDETIEKIHLERTMVIAQEVKEAGKYSYDLLERVAKICSIEVEDTQFFRMRDPNVCNQKRDFHQKIVVEKKQELKEQGYVVSDELFVIEAGGVKHTPDITYIKEGQPAFMDIKID